MRHRVYAVLAAGFCATGAVAAPVQWETAIGGNGHFYDFVLADTGLTAPQTEAIAESSVFNGLAGYLATITSAAEQEFLNVLWQLQPKITGQFKDFSYYLIGASDSDAEGDFRWIGGPEDGDALSYTNWLTDEPNDDKDGEDYVVGWWQDRATGSWNDYLNDEPYRAYVVEYSQPIAPIPLPAALPMLIGGLAGMAMLRRRRKG